MRDLIKDTPLIGYRRKSPGPGGILTHDTRQPVSPGMSSTVVLQPLPITLKDSGSVFTK